MSNYSNSNTNRLRAHEQFFLVLGLLISILVHLSYFSASLSDSQKKITPETFEVSLVAPLEQQTKIAPPSQKKLDTPKQPAQFKSDQDSSTDQQTIKKGDAPEAGPVANVSKLTAASNPQKAQQSNTPKQAAQSKQPAASENKNLNNNSKPSDSKPTPNKKLDLSTDYGLIAKLDGNKSAGNNLNKSSSNTSTTTASAPFSRAPGASAAFVGSSGVPDFIPGIRDGDITLLNAKADKFAVFVRRVAIQVFNYIKQMEWQNLSAEQIASIATSNIVVAVLDRSGKLTSVRLTRASGSGPFDQMLEMAVNKGAHDPNPPLEALAADGNFRFIFMAKSWTRMVAVGPRGGRGGEQRWLMLQTGLE
jgi:hypothetical protein